MKLHIVIISIVLLMLILGGCKQIIATDQTFADNTKSTENIDTSSSITEETSWKDRFEVRDTDAVVADLKEHFKENREEMETIALAMLKEYHKHSCEYHAQNGALFAVDPSDGRTDFSNPIDSNLADLIADYYDIGFSKSQDICIDNSHAYIKYDNCAFHYDAFLEDDGVLCNVVLLYCEEENAKGIPPAKFISLDEHWTICIIAYPY